MPERADRVAARLAERELDLLLVTDLVNVRWLTGFTGSNAAAIVGAPDGGVRRFITDFRYLTQAAEQVGDAWEREITQELIPRLAERLPAQGTPRVGFDDATMSVRDHARLAERAPAGVELVGAGGLVEELREVKEPEEIEKIRALAAVRPGPSGRELDAVAREIIASAGHGEHFGHGLGHGVGLEVHEGPRLSQTSDGVLGAGMVVTVEPGVYVPGTVGVRIEDLVVVTQDGADVLSSLPKEFQTVV